MPKAKKLPRHVTVAQHKAALMAMHRATVAAVSHEMVALEQRLRDEFGASRIVAALDEEVEPYHDVSTAMDEPYIGYREYPATYEGNHPAPTTDEGGE